MLVGPSSSPKLEVGHPSALSSLDTLIPVPTMRGMQWPTVHNRRPLFFQAASALSGNTLNSDASV
jgi:hypothetical protein